MKTLIWGNTFIKAFKRTIKKQPVFKQDIEETLRLLVKDPFAPQLETHKLKGKLSGSWACSAGYDLRIVFDFVKSEKQKEDAIFFACDWNTRRSVLNCRFTIYPGQSN